MGSTFDTIQHGWETALMVRRYAHLSTEHLATYAEKIGRPRVVQGTNLARCRLSEEVEKLQVID